MENNVERSNQLRLDSRIWTTGMLEKNQEDCNAIDTAYTFNPRSSPLTNLQTYIQINAMTATAQTVTRLLRSATKSTISVAINCPLILDRQLFQLFHLHALLLDCPSKACTEFPSDLSPYQRWLMPGACYRRLG